MSAAGGDNRASDPGQALPSALTDFRDRFVRRTLPIFADRGWDRERGGLVERLTPALLPDATPFRRSMVHGHLDRTLEYVEEQFR